MYIATTDIVKVQRGQWKARTTKTGPNDVSRIVWALGECIFFNIRVLSMLNSIYRSYRCIKGTVMSRLSV